MTTVLLGFGRGVVVVPLVCDVLISGHSLGEPGYDSAMQIGVATSTAVMVISASMATFKQHRSAKLVRGYIWPLAGYIVLGSVVGAVLASARAVTVSG